MKVSDILRVIDHTLFTITPEEPLLDAVGVMAEKDIGSLVVMRKGQLAGMLTFREVIQQLVQQRGALDRQDVASTMQADPLSCSSETDLDEVRRLMLEHHCRNMPVMDGDTLMGVISFYDVAKAVVEAQDFENKMLKAYIRDWPEKAGE